MEELKMENISSLSLCYTNYSTFTSSCWTTTPQISILHAKVLYSQMQP